ncbi:M20/M25/M40 family metallo-hydrolase (plasmid) [Nicoliella spurrieriana]|uniref:M20/M25/M40 family metallo-hydrolase n=1 Tax=Nicoliella spurrieriana TaxID=2925830 RepID=A0A976RQU2_9LACO|nr:M20/M25/M40 family metallo-hydrolase [Nicoliella spurrieriana]UQS86134.1 M20/M25/M40 family metallo-hydrolase [Nicoliella spurrieriana]
MTEHTFYEYVKAHTTDFFDYIRFRSISAQNQEIPETADWLVQQFNALNAQQATKWNDQGGNPVVFAEFKGHSDKTILFYNHYDVQPPEPLAEWRSDPFEPTVNDGKIYARGICDDKGELMSRLTAIQYFQTHGGLPVNVKFFVEGGEEVGSPHIEDYVAAHREALSSDVCIWEGGGKDENDHFQITCGLKGIVDFDLSVTTADKDIHSSLAAYAPNAAWRLVQALASLRSPDGKVLVKGFYDDIEPLDDTTRAFISKMQFNAEKAANNVGLKRSLITDDPAYQLVNGATMTINGISSGYEGDGIKTIIPKAASAKADCRLAPGQDPEKVFDLISKQLVANGFTDVKLHYNIGEKPFRTNMNDPFVKLNERVAKSVYGNNVAVIPNTPGGGPAYPFYDVLHDPILMVGIHYAGSGPHAPNEHIRVTDYQQGTVFMMELLDAYGKEGEADAK